MNMYFALLTQFFGTTTTIDGSIVFVTNYKREIVHLKMKAAQNHQL